MCRKAAVTFLVLNLTVVLLCVVTIVGAFNVNIKSHRVFKEPMDKGNLFGYAAALYSTDDGGLDALIGAPEASTNASEGGPKSGIVYKYKDILKSANIQPERVYYKGLIAMENGTHNEGFGSTMIARDSRNILICSPNWKDTQNSTTNYYTFLLGRCMLQRSNNLTELAPFYEQQPKRRYTKKIGSLSFYLRGLGTLGFSADMDEKFIAFGTPGIFNFEGAVYVNNLKTGQNYEMQIKEENNLKTSAYGSLGYSVKLGRFCGIAASYVCLAAGAPNLFNVGQVKIMRKLEKDKYITLVQEINGTEMWSNFGYSIGVVKIKPETDQYDELLIGAPLFTEWSNPNHIPDQGAVFLYKYDHDNKKFEKKDVVLDGSKLTYARFGAAISEIGDINLDGFSDFAIGAPGENNGAGCIYIYLGSASGFRAIPSQRIPASEVEGQLKGFGFAFSNNQIPKDKVYPVFASTSVVSEKVVVFSCRYIVEVETELTAIPNPVNTKVPCNSSLNIQGSCFQVKFCLMHTIKGEKFQPLNYSIHLEIDTKIKSVALKRSLFRLDKGEPVHMFNKTQVAVTNANTHSCTNFTAVLREPQINRDRFTPIAILAEYKLEPSQTPANDPVLDATKANNKTLEVTFVNECGSDAKCEVDLILSANAMHVPSDGLWSDVVVNYTKELNLKIEIKNKNDTAYGIVSNIEIDSFVSFLKAKSEPNCEAKTASANTTDTSSLSKDKTMITCNFFEPLDSNGEIKFNLFFDTDQDNVRKNNLHIRIDAFPKNKEHNQEILPEDNIKTINRKVYIVSNITLESLSSPNEHTIYDAKNKPDKKPKGQVSGKTENLLNVTHKILIRNQGPSYLPKTVVNVEIPVFIVEDSQLVTKAEVKMFTPAGEVYCEAVTNTGNLAGQSTTHSTDDDSDKDGSSTLSTTTIDDVDIGPQSQRRRRRSADSKCQGKTCFLRCKDNHNLCQLYACELNTILQPNGYAEINVTMALDLSSLFIAEDFNTLKFATHIEVKAPKHPLFKPWEDLKQQETITTFHFIQSGGKINIWIIIGSIIAGLVLITIIVLILWKIGFFKRTKHLEVQKMKRESMRRSMKGTSKPKTDE